MLISRRSCKPSSRLHRTYIHISLPSQNTRSPLLHPFLLACSLLQPSLFWYLLYSAVAVPYQLLPIHSFNLSADSTSNYTPFAAVPQAIEPPPLRTHTIIRLSSQLEAGILLLAVRCVRFATPTALIVCTVTVPYSPRVVDGLSNLLRVLRIPLTTLNWLVLLLRKLYISIVRISCIVQVSSDLPDIHIPSGKNANNYHLE